MKTIALERILSSAVLSVGMLLSPNPGAAQSDQGRLHDLLVMALERAAEGECPSRIMSPLLQDTCERQMPSMGQTLKRLGPIRSATFRGDQEMPGGVAEVYRVAFERGQMTWLINVGRDGKIVVLWSNG